jgi:hypothetical protein
MLAVVSVLGPALPITIVKLVVPPAAIVVLATTLLRLGVTTTPIVPGAVADVLPRLVTPTSGVSVTVLVYPPAAVALTLIVTLTVPFNGMVTLPRTVVPLSTNAVAVAPPAGVVTTEYAVMLLGRLSTMLAVVSVLGPALPITIVKLVVPPTAIVVLATTLLRLGVTTTPTVPGAVADVLPRLVTPTSGVSVTVLVYPPAAVALTLIVTLTVPFIGIVTLPRTVVPLSTNAVGTVAPACTALTTE